MQVDADRFSRKLETTVGRPGQPRRPREGQELRRENEELRKRVVELEQGQAGPSGAVKAG